MWQASSGIFLLTEEPVSNRQSGNVYGTTVAKHNLLRVQGQKPKIEGRQVELLYELCYVAKAQHPEHSEAVAQTSRRSLFKVTVNTSPRYFGVLYSR